jgi:saccharopine dehydrogenase (NAD+, L-lysine-forming)
MHEQFQSCIDACNQCATACDHCAGEIGGEIGTRRIDVEDVASVYEGLRDVSTVVCCVEQREDLVLREAVRRGLAYADLAPKLALRTDLDALDAEAKRSGARLAMGIGVCPGISSVMARALCDRLNGPPDEIETALLYGMGDQFGADSLGFIMRSATVRFEVALGGTRQPVMPWTRGKSVDFPQPFARRTAYLYPFSDAVMFPRTLGARTSIARLALDPPWIGSLAVAASRLRLLAMLAPRVRGSGWLRARLGHHDGFALVVRRAAAERERG